MATRRELEYILTLQDQTKRGFDTLEQRIREVEQGFNRVDRAGSKAGLTVTSAFKALGAAVSAAAVVDFARDSVQAFASFEKQLSLIGTLSDEAFAAVPKIGEQLRAMAIESGQSLEALTKAEFDVISATGDVRSSLESLDAAMRLAVAGGTDVATTTDGLTTLLNAFALSGHEAARASNALFEAQQFGKTTVAELASNLGQVAPAARAANVSMEELLGTMGAATRQLPTNVAATSLASFFYAISTASDEVIAKSRDLAAEAGVTGFEFSKAGVEAEGLATFLEKLSRIAGNDARKLRDLGIATEALKGVLVLTQNAARDSSDAIAKQVDGVEEAGKGFKRMADTAAHELARMGTAWEDVKTQFGKGFFEGVGGGAEGAADSIGKLADASSRAGENVGVMSRYLTAIASIDGTDTLGDVGEVGKVWLELLFGFTGDDTRKAIRALGTDRSDLLNGLFGSGDLSDGYRKRLMEKMDQGIADTVQEEYTRLQKAVIDGSKNLQDVIGPQLDAAFLSVLDVMQRRDLGEEFRSQAFAADAELEALSERLARFAADEKSLMDRVKAEAGKAVPRTSGVPIADPALSASDLFGADAGKPLIFPLTDQEKTVKRQLEEATAIRRDAALEFAKIGKDEFAAELLDLTDYYARKIEEVTGNEEAIRLIREAENDAVRAATARFDAEQLEKRTSFEQQIREISEDASLTRLAARGDELAQLDVWLQQEELRTARHYDELLSKAEEFSVDVVELETARENELTALREEHRRRRIEAERRAADRERRAREEQLRADLEGDDFGKGFAAQLALIDGSLTAGRAGADLATVSYSGLSDTLFDITRNGKSAGEAFKAFGRSVLDELIRIGTNKLAIQVLSSVFGIFAGGASAGAAAASGAAGSSAGGVAAGNSAGAASGGALSGILSVAGKGYAKGGIANRPSIFGEAGPEAAVPLPDGRRIPVKLMGDGGGGVVLNLTVQQTIAPNLIDAKGADAVLARSAKQVAAIVTDQLDRHEGLRTRVRRAAQGR